MSIKLPNVYKQNNITVIGYEKVTCTIYNPTSSQGWGDGSILYDGTKIQKNVSSGYRFIAVSEDLLWKYPIGSLVEVCCFENSEYYTGFWQVRDKMNSRKKNHIDFLQENMKMKLRKNYCFIRRVE